MNLEQARTNMVEQQIRTWEVLDQEVLDLLYVIPREEFVPQQHRALAFSDLELPIGEGERMWQPKLEARVLQELALKRTDRVLEVGTGSGYLTALMAHRAAEVCSVDIRARAAGLRPGESRAPRHRQRHPRDRRRGARLGAARALRRHRPDGLDADPAAGFLDQLAPGGRLFAVVGEAPAMQARLVTSTAPGASSSVDLFETVLRPLANAEQPRRFRF
jgi:protein-L-isoaspartate(D-aspartate) O-methyltransferase